LFTMKNSLTTNLSFVLWYENHEAMSLAVLPKGRSAPFRLASSKIKTSVKVSKICSGVLLCISLSCRLRVFLSVYPKHMVVLGVLKFFLKAGKPPPITRISTDETALRRLFLGPLQPTINRHLCPSSQLGWLRRHLFPRDIAPGRLAVLRSL
jgi:hypothetical protein